MRRHKWLQAPYVPASESLHPAAIRSKTLGIAVRMSCVSEFGQQQQVVLRQQNGHIQPPNLRQSYGGS